MHHTNADQMREAVSTWRAAAIVADAPDGCPVRNILDKLGDKWSMLVILMLSGEALRFSQIRRLIPDISQKMLTQTLRHLQRDGLVSRQVFPTVPPSVEYRLTDLGRSLLEPFGHLVAWANAHDAAIARARSRFDQQIPI